MSKNSFLKEASMKIILNINKQFQEMKHFIKEKMI